MTLDVGGGGGGFYSSGAGNRDSGGKGFLEGGLGGQVSSISLMSRFGGFGGGGGGARHVLGVGEVVEVTLVGVVEGLPAVVGEDLIMSGEINKITCITGHLLVMVW